MVPVPFLPLEKRPDHAKSGKERGIPQTCRAVGYPNPPDLKHSQCSQPLLQGREGPSVMPEGSQGSNHSISNRNNHSRQQAPSTSCMDPNKPQNHLRV